MLGIPAATSIELSVPVVLALGNQFVPVQRLAKPLCRLVEGIGGQIHVQKPAEQNICVDPLNKLAFRADRLQSLQQHRVQKPLGRHAGTPGVRIRLIEQMSHTRQGFIHELLDRPQEMIRPNPVLRVHGIEHVGLTNFLSTHGGLLAGQERRHPATRVNTSFRRVFAAAC